MVVPTCGEWDTFERCEEILLQQIVHFNWKFDVFDIAHQNYDEKKFNTEELKWHLLYL